jgi:hypothetical protein
MKQDKKAIQEAPLKIEGVVFRPPERLLVLRMDNSEFGLWCGVFFKACNPDASGVAVMGKG